jgi:outer membrane lipoprotein-sorting protein
MRVQSLMTPVKTVLAALIAIAMAAGAALKAAPQAPPIPVDEIIQKFAAKEREFQLARANYTYRQDVRVQELDGRGAVAGEYHEVMDILFDEKMKRVEKTVFAPPSSLKRISMTPEDIEDIRSIQPFVLTTADIPKYSLKYTGRERIDEIGCYVFEVSPKKMEKGQRYFEGKIWVDDQDLQIVKTYGKAVPDIRGGKENLFPRFETYREQIDDYWFPTYTRADDTLNFSTGPVRMRQTIRYQNYKRFTSNVTIIPGGAAGDDGKPSTGQPRK